MGNLRFDAPLEDAKMVTNLGEFGISEARLSGAGNAGTELRTTRVRT